MSIDEDILSKADKWEREKLNQRRREADQQHERWNAIGRFVKKIVFIGGALSLVGGGAFWGIPAVMASCDANEAEDLAQKRQTREDAEHLDHLYETAWLKCVEALDIETCTLVGERGLRQCAPEPGTEKHNGTGLRMEECFDRVLGTRAEKLRNVESP